MPLTSKGEKIRSAMEAEYGSKKGQEVFYASSNKGTISGVDAQKLADAVDNLEKRVDKFGLGWGRRW